MSDGAISLLILGGFLLIVSLLVLALIRNVRTQHHDSAEFTAWVTENGYTLGALTQPRPAYSFMPLARLSLFNRGTFAGEMDVASGTYQKLQFETFTDTFKIPQGRSQSTLRVHTIRATGDFSFPRIYLDRKKNNSVFRPVFFSSPIQNFSNLSLEGDFNSYFDVICERGLEQEVTQVLAPNIMQQLKKVNPHVDIELSGNSIYLYFSEYDSFTLFDEAVQILLQAFETAVPSLNKVATLDPLAFGKNVTFPVSTSARKSLRWIILLPFILVAPLLFVPSLSIYAGPAIVLILGCVVVMHLLRRDRYK